MTLRTTLAAAVAATLVLAPAAALADSAKPATRTERKVELDRSTTGSITESNSGQACRQDDGYNPACATVRTGVYPVNALSGLNLY